ncbi:hypothetical protein FMO003_24840 [Moritella sp. F3]|nr:hypothetical protein FMO001_18110 [Moritella sp. F1]GIC82203.1 hypothetical protein FMO003_24840 [Moritella sp. F3]
MNTLSASYQHLSPQNTYSENSYALCFIVPIYMSMHCLYLLFDARINIKWSPGLNPLRQL